MERKNWQEVLSKLADAHKDEILKIKRQDLVEFCVNSNTLRNVVDVHLKSVKISGKDSAIAIQKKEEGNKKFQERKYQDSLKLYTESIFHANKNDEVLPLSYANRSVVLRKLGHLSESLADINMALANGYPKNKVEKLRSKCLEMMKIKNDPKNGKHDYQLPKLSGGVNKDFASASAYLSVFFDETRGRHVVATQDIQFGEVLFVEKAFSFTVYEEACNQCLRKSLAPIPCEGCLDKTYCSPKCRRDSWKSAHSFQCGYGELFKSVRIADLGLQMISAASSSLNQLKNKLNGISEPNYKNGPVLLRSKSYGSVYNLLHHFDKHEIIDLFQQAMTALLLAMYLKNHTEYFPAVTGDSDLKFLTTVILRHILQINCNSHAITGQCIRGEESSAVLSKAVPGIIATAIYPSVSMMNHSCLPSVIIGFYRNYAIVQAAKNIKKGEEVFDCYAADAREMERALRQDKLSKQYFFKCKCQACLETFDFQDKFTAFRCDACQGPSIQKDKNALETICSDCGQKSEVSVELGRKNKEFYSLFQQAKLLQSINITLSLEKSLKAWTLGREIFYKYHKHLSSVADMAAWCLIHHQEFSRAIPLRKYTVLSAEKRFGFVSLEFVEEVCKAYELQLIHAACWKGMPPLSVILDLFWIKKKCEVVTQILDGNPHFVSMVTLIEKKKSFVPMH